MAFHRRHHDKVDKMGLLSKTIARIAIGIAAHPWTKAETAFIPQAALPVDEIIRSESEFAQKEIECIGVSASTHVSSERYIGAKTLFDGDGDKFEWAGKMLKRPGFGSVNYSLSRSACNEYLERFIRERTK